MYFDPNAVLEQDFLLNFVVSERGSGKTFSTLKHCVEKFLETGEQFVYLRRSEIERDNSITTLLSQLQDAGFFLDNVFRVKEDYITCDGKIICRCLAISTAYKHKSVSFHKVKTVIFDEFIDENNRYLKEEAIKFLSLMESIGRMREFQIICLGNKSTDYNPYYLYFNIKSSGSKFTRFRSRSIMIHEFKSGEYRAAKLNTKFGQLIAGTTYGNFMLNNEAIKDDYTFIDKLKGFKKIPIANIIIDKTNVVMYDAIGEGFFLYFLIRDDVPNIKTINYDKMFVEGATLDLLKNNPVSKKIVQKSKNGYIRFNDMEAKLLINKLIF